MKDVRGSAVLHGGSCSAFGRESTAVCRKHQFTGGKRPAVKKCAGSQRSRGFFCHMRADGQIQGYLPGVVVRLHGQLVNIGAGDPLHPDTLPDAALGGIENASPLQGLFSPGLASCLGKILYPKDELVILRKKEGRDVSLEGQIAAFVGQSFMTVDKESAQIVHGSKMQKKSFPRMKSGLIHGKRSAVPEIFIRPKLSSNAGEGGLRGEGDQNVPFISGGGFAVPGNGIVPAAVEADAGLTHHLRSWVFGKNI